MRQTTKKLLISIAQVVALIAVALLLWYVVALATNVEMIVPKPSTVAKTTFQLLGKGQTYLALLATLLRSVIAFALSLVVAFALSMLVILLPKCRFCVNAVVTFLRALPTIAVILATLILFEDTTVPVVVALLVVFPVVYSMFKRELERSGNLLAMCQVYQVSAAKKIKFVLLPIVRDELLGAVGDQLPLCIKVVVAGEVLSRPLHGLGKEMSVGKVNLDMAAIVALTILTLIVCFAISGVTSLVQRKTK